MAQQLALWLPADGGCSGSSAELAAAHGDVQTAAAIMDGCVTEFGLRAPELRDHRQADRAAADELAKKATPPTKAAHEGPRRRPQAALVAAAGQPARRARTAAGRATGVNALPWAVLADTTLDRPFKVDVPEVPAGTGRQAGGS